MKCLICNIFNVISDLYKIFCVRTLLKKMHLIFNECFTEWFMMIFFCLSVSAVYDLQRFGREKFKPFCFYVSSGVIWNTKVEFQPFALLALLSLSVIPVKS